MKHGVIRKVSIRISRKCRVLNERVEGSEGTPLLTLKDNLSVSRSFY